MRVRRAQKISNKQKMINLEYQYYDDDKPVGRTFKYKYYDEDCSKYRGRIKSKFPKNAASKVLTRIAKMDDLVDVDIKLSIKECTRGVVQKEFHYEGKRCLLDHPECVTISYNTEYQRQILYKYKNFITRMYENHED